MTKQEIEQAIENGESVWYPKNRTIKQIDLKNTHPIFNGYQIDIMIEDENGWHTEFYGIKDLYKTKAEAEHYLNHANITRTEQLPFLTWEEFKGKRELKFNSVDGNYCELFIVNDFIYLQIGDKETAKQQNVGEATEENFYKAYDECVRLFRGGKNETLY